MTAREAQPAEPPWSEPEHPLDPVSETVVADRRADANRALGMGLGIGALGVASAALLGAVCPVCVVAAPALLVTGIVRHVRAHRPLGRP